VAGIWNVNSIYNSNMKKVSSKLTFQLGETFSARVTSLNSEKGEGLLKLLDGWQFPVKVEKPLDFAPGELLKFQVVGYEEGKLKIKSVSTTDRKSYKEDKSIDNILAENSIDSEEYEILEKMIRHNMPLTKENISKIKSLNDFIKKIGDSTTEEDEFIEKYLESRNILVNSSKGNETKILLKDFLNKLKNIDLEDLLTMLENNIEINNENIGSFNKIFKGSMEFYKVLKEVEAGLKTIQVDSGHYELLDNTGDVLEVYHKNAEEKLEAQSSNISNKGTIGTAAYYKSGNGSAKVNNGSIMDLLKAASRENYELKNVIKEIVINNGSGFKEEIYEYLNRLETFTDEKIFDVLKWIVNSKPETLNTKLQGFGGLENQIPSKDDIQEMFRILLGDSVNIKDSGFEKLVNIIKKMIDENNSVSQGNGVIEKVLDKSTSEVIKEQIRIKTDEMKGIIKDIIVKGKDVESEAYSKVIGLVKNSLNDFKVLNTVSNGYYYMDLPINFKENEYPCKLIIKDERDKGKIIDSKNVKLVVSVKTINMGTIDGYIRVKDLNINIEIRSDEKWVQVLEISKEKLLKSLNSIGYSLNLTINNRERELTLTNCREFFEDYELSNIDIKV
jgi:hypothetical protein